MFLPFQNTISIHYCSFLYISLSAALVLCDVCEWTFSVSPDNLLMVGGRYTQELLDGIHSCKEFSMALLSFCLLSLFSLKIVPESGIQTMEL